MMGSFFRPLLGLGLFSFLGCVEVKETLNRKLVRLAGMV